MHKIMIGDREVVEHGTLLNTKGEPIVFQLTSGAPPMVVRLIFEEINTETLGVISFGPGGDNAINFNLTNFLEGDSGVVEPYLIGVIVLNDELHNLFFAFNIRTLPAGKDRVRLVTYIFTGESVRKSDGAKNG